MKKINRYLSFLLVLSMMMCSTFLFTVSTAETENEDIAVGVTGNPGSENELQPMIASSCDDYTYFNNGLTMQNVADSNLWNLVYYTDDHGYLHANIYRQGAPIGRYDITSSYGQNPHFHLYSTPGVHYWVYF